MARNKITITQLQGGLNRRSPSTDNVCGLVMGGVAVASKIALGEIKALKSPADADTLGLDAAYDTTNNVLVRHHIDRFFLRNPNGELRILLAAQGTSMTDMCDKDNAYLKTLAAQSKNELRAVGVVLNPLVAYSPTLSGGLDGDVFTAIPKAQETIDEEFGFSRMFDVILEGREYNGTATSATDLRGLTAKNVHVVAFQDPTIAATHAIHAKYAAVGDVLGLISKSSVSQNIGEQIQEFNLTDIANGVFVSCALSSGTDINQVSDTDRDTLHDKGYIFGDIVIGLSGFWLNDSHSCVALSSDYAYLENNTTIHKAISLLRTALLPKVKSRIFIDPETGFIDPLQADGLEAEGETALNVLLADGDVSGGIQVVVNREKDLSSGDDLEVQLLLTPVTIGRQIALSVGFNVG